MLNYFELPEEEYDTMTCANHASEMATHEINGEPV